MSKEMHKDMSDKVSTKHLNAIGQILSVFTHELQNTLSIMRESAGLMADIFDLEKKSGKVDFNKHMDRLRAIDNQVGRGITLSQHLSRFSKRLDEPISIFNVNEAIEELISLMQRLIDQRRMTVKKDFNNKIPAINNNPALFQLAVFCSLEIIFNGFDQKSEIVIKTEVSNEFVTVRIIPKGSRIIPAEDKNICSYELMKEVIERLGGRSEKNDDEELLIYLPCSAN